MATIIEVTTTASLSSQDLGLKKRYPTTPSPQSDHLSALQTSHTYRTALRFNVPLVEFFNVLVRKTVELEDINLCRTKALPPIVLPTAEIRMHPCVSCLFARHTLQALPNRGPPF